MPAKSIIAFIQDRPKSTAWIGALSGWASVDWLRTAQLSAAILAAMVSLCALIMTAPKVIVEVKSWFHR